MSILSKLKRRKHQKPDEVLSLRSAVEIDAISEKLDGFREWQKSLSPAQRKELDLRFAEAQKNDVNTVVQGLKGMPRVGQSGLNALKAMPRMQP